MKNEQVRLAQLKILELKMHEQLHEYYSQCREINGGEAMMYDKTGASSFVIVAFNNVVSPDLLPDDSDPQDIIAAIASASNMISPDVTPSEEGTIGPDETIPVGVHAIAASMLLGSLQGGAIVEVMKMSQNLTLEYHTNLKKAH